MSMFKKAFEGVLDACKKDLDTYVQETYGTIPSIVQVQVNEAPVVTLEGPLHHKFELVLNLCVNRIPVMLVGPTGSGKNVICQNIAKSLDLEFYFSNAITQEYKLTGFIDAHGKFQSTQFYEAFTNGGVFMLDEIDASVPDVLITLNAAISNGYFDFPTGRKEAHPDFICVAAGNTFGKGADLEYTGRTRLDAASLDRFAVVSIDYDPAIEQALANGNTELLSFLRDVRSAFRKYDIDQSVSYRTIANMSTLDHLHPEAVISAVLLKSLRRDDLETIKELFDYREDKYSQGLIASLETMNG